VRTKVDVLGNRGLVQPSLARTAGKALILAAGCLAIDEQPEPILTRQRGGVGDVLQFDEGVGHGGEAERAQSLDSRMDQHSALGLLSSSVIVAGAADILVNQDRRRDRRASITVASMICPPIVSHPFAFGSA
jgi:hypothetical protein